MEKSMMPGGWSEYGPVDPESKAVFEKATAGLVGVHYTPKEVSKQVVSGVNYRFRCDAEPVVPHPKKFHAVVEIYQPLNGDPTITKIVVARGPEEIKGGGWTPFRPVDPESREVFAVAMRGLIGVDYKPLEVSTQVVAGTNYRFICDATIPGTCQYKALVKIYQPLEGKPVVIEIDPI